MPLRDQWQSIEDWAIANGMTLDDALEEGISQDDDDVIIIPDSYEYPTITAEQYYDTVDVEIYISCENPSKVKEVIDFLLDTDSDFILHFAAETSGIEYDKTHTDFADGKQAYFCYLHFIKDRESDFCYPLSLKFPDVNVTAISSNPDINYWSENVFEAGRWVINEESTFQEKAPDIYRDYIIEKAEDLM